MDNKIKVINEPAANTQDVNIMNIDGKVNVLHRKMNSNTSFTGYINKPLLEYVIKRLEVQQNIYFPSNNTNTAKSSIDVNKINSRLANVDILSNQLTYLKNILDIDSMNTLMYYKSNVKNSLLHSFIYLFDPHYKLSSWERKENLAIEFKYKIIQDLFRDKELLHQMKLNELNSTKIKEAIDTNQINLDVITFFSIYFRSNLLIFNENNYKIIPTSDLDICKPWIFLYQYAYGIYVPVYAQIDNTKISNLFVYSSSPILKKLLDHINITLDQQLTTGSANSVKKDIPDAANETESSKVMYTTKMTLKELQEIAISFSIDIKKKGKNTSFKNKTKQEIIDDLNKI
jgi:hypothetical protein